jgi:hypothetical protein
MKRNPILLGLVVFILLASPAYSLETIGFEEVDGETLYSGDFVDLGIVLFNDESSEINLTVKQYVVHPGISPMPLYQEIVIEPGEDTMISDLSFFVTDYTKSGEYKYVLVIYDSESMELVTKKTSVFQVSGTSKRFTGTELTICADPACDDLRPVFLLGEIAYIFLQSRENPQITGYVVSSEGERTDLDFEDGSAEFKGSSEDVYTANIELSKEGFLTENIEKDITFVEEAAKPVSYFCNQTEDGICEDCPEGEDPDCGKLLIGYENMIIMIAIILILGFGMAFYIRSKR